MSNPDQPAPPANATTKSSIFICKLCKANQVPIEKKIKSPKEKPEIIDVKLEPSKQKDTKWCVKVSGRKICFGAKGMTDFTINPTLDQERKLRYINRHQKREHQFWTADPENLETASFWSRFLLWNDRDIFASIENIEKMMGCSIKFTKNTVERHQRKLSRLSKAMPDEEE